MFSRVQHHFHEKTKKGYIPLRTCVSKRSKGVCKHDFPMEKRLTKRLRIICQGNARRFGLRIKGKRNQIGMTLGKRTDIWQSGTAMVFAVFCRSNTHTAPNYRMPPMPSVHDDEYCSKACFSKPEQMKVICAESSTRSYRVLLRLHIQASIMWEICVAGDGREFKLCRVRS